MSLPPPTPERTQGGPAPRRRTRRTRRYWFLGAAAAALLLAWFGGRALWGLHHWRTGCRALQQDDFAAALAGFRRCLRVWPGSAAVRLRAARAARRGGLLPLAEEHLAACEEHGATDETALERALLDAQRGELHWTARPLLEKVQAGSPDAGLIFEALVRGYFHKRSLGPALNLLDEWLRRDPDAAAAHYWRGRIFADLDQGGYAVRAFRRAVELAPHATTYRVGLAAALAGNGLFEEAFPHLRALLPQVPDDPEVRLGMARCLRAFSRPAEAVAHLDAVLGDHPDNADAWAEKGHAFRDQGDLAGAARCLERAVKQRPWDYTICFALFTVLQEQGRTQEAKAAWEHLERVRRESNRLRELQAQVERGGRGVAASHELGSLFLRLGSEDVGLRWLRAALEEAPDHRPTHALLADYYTRKGDLARAAEHGRLARRPGR
jgi:tetratricopeptide (TPR) repeat protein